MRKIIIDTDPGIDDAIAILLALSAKQELDVVALTTVNGNVTIDKNTKNACRILEIVGRCDIPVYRGSEKPLVCPVRSSEEVHGKDGLGDTGLPEPKKVPEAEDAVDFLVRRAREEKGELTLLPIGPLTNIAKAVQRDAEFAKNIKEVVIMGGGEKLGNITPVAEFNFWEDPEAAKIVFEAGFEKVTMIGLDATGYIWLTPAHRELLYQINTPVSRFMYDITRVYSDIHWDWERRMGCELCDALIPAYLLDPAVITAVDAYVDIETQGICAGTSVVYRSGRYPDKKPNCQVAVGADGKRFFDLLFRYLFPEYAEIAANIKL